MPCAMLRSLAERLLLLLMPLFLLVGQHHLCEPTYILPSGELCQTCPTSACQSKGRVNPQASSDHRTCCKLGPCLHKNNTVAATSNPSSQPDAILSEPFLVARFTQFEVLSPFKANTQCAPIPSPPDQDHSRAPPLLAWNLLPSAGRRFVIA